MDADLEALLKKAKTLRDRRKKAAQPPLSRKKAPQALVLFFQSIHCQGCGSVQKAANSHILFDYGKERKEPDHWNPDYNHLPRKLYEVQVNIPCCHCCFTTIPLTESNVIRKGKK